LALEYKLFHEHWSPAAEETRKGEAMKTPITSNPSNSSKEISSQLLSHLPAVIEDKKGAYQDRLESHLKYQEGSG